MSRNKPDASTLDNGLMMAREHKRRNLHLIPRTRPNFDIASLLTSMRYGRTPGDHCNAAESAVASRLGVRHVILTPSGRGGLFLLLQCLPSGRVCIPGYTCSAVAEAIALSDREITYLEHSRGSINLTTEDIAGRLQPGDIFVLTHQYGYATNVAQIVEAATQQGAIVIEDIAAAFAGACNGKPLGSFGLAAFGSFDTSKLIHVPMKGGFVATDDDALAATLRTRAKLVFHRMSVTHATRLVLLGCLLHLVTRPTLYWLFHAINFRLRGKTSAEDGILARKLNAFYSTEFAEWQAAIALPQLRRLDEIIHRRAEVHDILQAACASSTLFKSEPSPPEIAGTSVRLPIYAIADKMALYQSLVANGVDCGFSFTMLATPKSLSESWRIAGSVLNLPCYGSITPDELTRLAMTLESLEKQ
ncbi:MAG: DegT/DnrJ/EryC1/StrS family aminotransferase [Thermomonas sp.]|uniref:DegT/DnrJ/EryC1/StrS family aminotransferase n=1 Tax=Thermomonas sp. TaxID=1971895 RepID=UPI00262FA32B|nr:DegT/DnrJ/EryC1/StrS family aminotransferase [Thermomonas sp.]MCC7097781.1 DegT/DnrJ/EryC1/StrS family aminotransferase [Thermomonas sp.]